MCTRKICLQSESVRSSVRPSSPAPRILLPSRSEIQPQQEQTETDSYYECRAAAGRRVGDQIYCREEENCGDESKRGNCPMHAVPNTHVLWRRCTTDIQIFAKVPRDSLSSSEGPRRNLKEQVVFSAVPVDLIQVFVKEEEEECGDCRQQQRRQLELRTTSFILEYRGNLHKWRMQKMRRMLLLLLLLMA